MDALVEACMENELFRRDVLQALVALIPEVRQRADLGLDADTREDALMDAIAQLLAEEVGEHGTVEAISTTDPVSRMARSYAARILRNRLIDELRRRRRHDLAALGREEKHPGTGTEAELSYRQRQLLQHLLTGSSESDTRLLLAYFRDRDAFQTELERQGLREGTARVRVHRALKRLRERGTAALLGQDGRRK